MDLLVTDIGLPGGMSGFDLAVAVRKRDPLIPVLYLSGYSDGSSSEFAERYPDAQFLAKPYDNPTLATAIRRALATIYSFSPFTRAGPA